MKLELTAEEYFDHCESYDGFCTKCGAIRYGSTEPDAEGYECFDCGEMAAIGMENALIMDLIEVKEEEYD